MAAMKALSKFIDPAQVAQRGDLVMAFKPKPEDYERVFTAEAASKARIAYQPLWETPPPPVPKPGQSVLRVNVYVVVRHGTQTQKTKRLLEILRRH